MIRLTLSQRLSLVFSVLLLASSGTGAWLQVRSNTMHEQVLVQRLSSDLAEHIAGSAELMDENGLRPDAVRKLFGQLMTVNPSVEVYLLDAAGKILGHAAPAGHVRRQTVDTRPIERLLAGAPLPILGDDPRSDRDRKVFSAAPLERDGRTWGYVYVILQGEARDMLAADVGSSGVLRTTLWSMAVVALLGLTAGLVAFRGITRPLRAVTAAVHEIDLDRLAAAGPPAAAQGRRPPGAERDEIAILENAFGRMAARIADQWRELKRQDQERRELVANISHDLRTPLTSLHGFLETLSRKHDLGAAERERYLETALAQSEKVGRLAGELFELARLEHDAGTLEQESFSLADLVQDVLQKFALLAEAKRATLVTEIPPDLPNVVASLPMIERVLTNLIDNAIRHTPGGTEVAVALRDAGARVEVTISDDGPGVPAALRETLFRRPSALTGKRSGRGMGLLIVHRILELHGSRVELLGARRHGAVRGHGAVFRFALPVDQRGS
jgi:signal transduction histidine kinase